VSENDTAGFELPIHALDLKPRTKSQGKQNR
jgi:hypothetical protein